MNISEIKRQKWIIQDDFYTTENRLTSLNLLEQETHINKMRIGTDLKNPEISVCCSDQTMITELSKSEYFILRNALISSNPTNKGFILQIEGNLENNGITLRKKKREFSEEELKRLRNNFKNNNPKK